MWLCGFNLTMISSTTLSIVGALVLAAGAAAQATAPQYGQVRLTLLLSYTFAYTCSPQTVWRPRLVRRHRLPIGVGVHSLQPVLFPVSSWRGRAKQHAGHADHTLHPRRRRLADLYCQRPRQPSHSGLRQLLHSCCGTSYRSSISSLSACSENDSLQEDPNFHQYLRSEVEGTASDAVLGDYTTAAQFQITGGQLIQEVADGTKLYAVVEGRSDPSVMKLKMSWSTEPASGANAGTFVFSGDTVEWSIPTIQRPQTNVSISRVSARAAEAEASVCRPGSSVPTPRATRTYTSTWAHTRT